MYKDFDSLLKETLELRDKSISVDEKLEKLESKRKDYDLKLKSSKQDDIVTNCFIAFCGTMYLANAIISIKTKNYHRLLNPYAITDFAALTLNVIAKVETKKTIELMKKNKKYFDHMYNDYMREKIDNMTAAEVESVKTKKLGERKVK